MAQKGYAYLKPARPKLVYRSMRFRVFSSSHRPLALAVAMLAVGVASSSYSQTPSAPATPAPDVPQGKTATLSVAAKLVNVPVVVRDKKGALIQTLTKDDFVLQVDGKPQTIRYFDQDRDIPLTLGLLVDTSMSQRKVLDEERNASAGFLDQVLVADKDKAFIIQFAHAIDLLQDLTNSRPKLQAALKQIDSDDAGYSGNNSGNSGDNSNSNGSSGGRGHAGGTTLYDALFLASDELMKKQQGRKAVIILSDGVDRGSKESLTRSIEAAQRADTIVYAIYFKGSGGGGGYNNNNGGHGGGFPGGGGGRGGGMGWPGGGGGGGGHGNHGGGGSGISEVDGKKILQRMANETGGRLFEISGKNTVDAIYTQIGQELRAQYRLGYTPDKETASDGYHQIDLTLRQPDQQKKLTVQTRDGYYSGD
jgi:VWFA-related protein